MGGPWRDRGFDPTAWRPPAPRVEADLAAPASGGSDRLTAIVITYVVSVVTSLAIMLVGVKSGGW